MADVGGGVVARYESGDNWGIGGGDDLRGGESEKEEHSKVHC